MFNFRGNPGFNGLVLDWNTSLTCFPPASGIRVLVDAREKLHIPWGDPSNQRHGDTMMAFDTRSVMAHGHGMVEPKVFQHYLPSIRALWADQGIQNAYDRRREFQLVSDNATWLMYRSVTNVLSISGAIFDSTQYKFISLRGEIGHIELGAGVVYWFSHVSDPYIQLPFNPCFSVCPVFHSFTSMMLTFTFIWMWLWDVQWVDWGGLRVYRQALTATDKESSSQLMVQSCSCWVHTDEHRQANEGLLLFLLSVPLPPHTLPSSISPSLLSTVLDYGLVVSCSQDNDP